MIRLSIWRIKPVQRRPILRAVPHPVKTKCTSLLTLQVSDLLDEFPLIHPEIIPLQHRNVFSPAGGIGPAKITTRAQIALVPENPHLRVAFFVFSEDPCRSVLRTILANHYFQWKIGLLRQDAL